MTEECFCLILFFSFSQDFHGFPVNCHFHSVSQFGLQSFRMVPLRRILSWFKKGAKEINIMAPSTENSPRFSNIWCVIFDFVYAIRVYFWNQISQINLFHDDDVDTTML